MQARIVRFHARIKNRGARSIGAPRAEGSSTGRALRSRRFGRYQGNAVVSCSVRSGTVVRLDARLHGGIELRGPSPIGPHAALERRPAAERRAARSSFAQRSASEVGRRVARHRRAARRFTSCRSHRSPPSSCRAKRLRGPDLGRGRGPSGGRFGRSGDPRGERGGSARPLLVEHEPARHERNGACFDAERTHGPGLGARVGG